MSYYDSLFHGRIKDNAKMQICNMYICFEEERSVNVWASKQQSNDVDCKVYPIANVFNFTRE